MKSFLITIMLLSSLVFTFSAIAGTATDQLAVCMADSLTGKERKKMAEWIFLAMSVHPDIGKSINIPDHIRVESAKFIGSLITRLLTEDCASKAKRAVSEENSVAIQKSFEFLGKVAMQELMTNQNVAKAISGFEQYVDSEKIDGVFR